MFCIFTGKNIVITSSNNVVIDSLSKRLTDV